MRFLLFLFLTVFFTDYSIAQIVGGSFKPGYYYDLDGVKNDGYINQKPSSLSRSAKTDNAILFKSGKSSRKRLVYAGNIQSYVVDADSFAVVTLPASMRDVRYRIDFAKVLFDEKVKVFLIDEKVSPSFGLSAGNRGAMPSINLSDFGRKIYLFGSSGNSVEVMDKKNYREVLSSALAAYPDLVDKVNSGQMGYDDIERLSKEYLGKRSSKL